MKGAATATVVAALVARKRRRVIVVFICFPPVSGPVGWAVLALQAQAHAHPRRLFGIPTISEALPVRSNRLSSQYRQLSSQGIDAGVISPSPLCGFRRP